MPEQHKMSPFISSNCSPNETTLFSHQVFSPPRPSKSSVAHFNLTSQSIISFSKLVFFWFVSSNLFCKSSNCLSTSQSSAYLSQRPSIVTLYCSSASQALFHLGVTNLLTLSYSSNAQTQRHNPSAASEAYATQLGLNSGSGINYFQIFSMISGLMLSQSNSINWSRKFFSLINLVEVTHQFSSNSLGLSGFGVFSAFHPTMIQTAWSTFLIGLGGLPNAFNSLMSFG